MSTIKTNRKTLQKQDDNNNDLNDFLQAYLKSLLLYNPQPENILLPQLDKEQSASKQNLFTLLNEIVNSTELVIEEDSAFKSPSFIQPTIKKSRIQIINEQEKIPSLNEQEVSVRGIKLGTLSKLTLKGDHDQSQLSQIQQKGFLCWG